MKPENYLYGAFGGMILLVLVVLYIDHKQEEENSAAETSAPTNSKSAKKPDNNVHKEMMSQLQKNIEAHRARNEAIANARHRVREPDGTLRLPTPEEEAHLQAWLEEQRKAKEEEAYWESRQEWIENFPFEPTYHPEITFDPEVLKDRVDENGRRIPRDNDYWIMAGMQKQHGFIKNFYEMPVRYSPEFEQMYNIMVEAGLEMDPYIWGRAFTHLTWYHNAMKHDPEKLRREGQTWGEEQQDILGSFWVSLSRKKDWGYSEKILLSQEEAEALRDRLIAEIPPDRFLTLGALDIFGHNQTYADELKTGDPMLVR